MLAIVRMFAVIRTLALILSENGELKSSEQRRDLI